MFKTNNLPKTRRPGEGPGHDWFCMYYRDLSMALSLGYTVEDALLAHMAKAGDVNSGGRQMPEHYSSKERGIFSGCSAVAVTSSCKLMHYTVGDRV